jgi:RimJ/RimL family protein N-acetyltransferase
MTPEGEPHMVEESGTTVELADGSRVLIDQVHREDAPLLAEGFARLSAESRRLRFLTSKPSLSPAEVEYFTHVDHHDHEAIGAVDLADGRGVGIARYIRDPTDSTLAELAVTVVDDFQGRGLGTELLTRLMDRAGEEGITRFRALVDAQNDAIVRLLRQIGDDLRVTESGAGVVEYELSSAPEDGDPMHDLLRAFGRKQLRAPVGFREVLDALVPKSFHRERR